MDFGCQFVPLWERPAEQLLAGELGLAPLAMLGQLAQETAVEDGLAAVAQRLVERFTRVAEPARATKLLTSALLLTGLRVDRHAALKIFRGVHMVEESNTYLMILERSEERGKSILAAATPCGRLGKVGRRRPHLSHCGDSSPIIFVRRVEWQFSGLVSRCRRSIAL
jgi:hypothetical protein